MAYNYSAVWLAGNCSRIIGQNRNECKINAFVELVRPFSIKEMARTGKVDLEREGI